MPERTAIRNITPYLTVNDAKAAADFYTRAFGAKETFVRETDDGGVAHMALSIGDGVLNVADSSEWGRWTHLPANEHSSVGWLCLEVPSCDEAFRAAIGAGATEDIAPETTPWGDRYARVRDPFGQVWSLSSPPRKD